jgi:hypothetical protein
MQNFCHVFSWGGGGHVIVCGDLREELKNYPWFLMEVVTGDESWCYGYDPEAKQQSSQWMSPNSPRPKKDSIFTKV